jgi:hypothetical protein
MVQGVHEGLRDAQVFPLTGGYAKEAVNIPGVRTIEISFEHPAPYWGDETETFHWNWMDDDLIDPTPDTPLFERMPIEDYLGVPTPSPSEQPYVSVTDVNREQFIQYLAASLHYQETSVEMSYDGCEVCVERAGNLMPIIANYVGDWIEDQDEEWFPYSMANAWREDHPDAETQ